MARLCFLVIWWLPVLTFAAQVENLRVWHAPDQTRLVLDLSGPVSFQAFTIGKPDRVVIDLIDSVVGPKVVLPTQVRSRVTGLRSARRGSDTRLVFDLAESLTLRHALLPPHAPYGHRLVLDLIDPTPTAAPAAAPKPAPAPVPAPPAAAAAKVTPVPATPPPQAVKVADTPAAPVRERVVAIDAGHGGEDVGAIGPRGTYEKTVVLAIARELAALIEAEPDMRAVLIRDGDYYVGLRERMVKARRQRADLFVSIHADAFRNRSVRGSSVYVLSHGGATNEAARWLAERENAADLVGGVTLDDKDHQLRSVLLDLSQTATMEDSLAVADQVLGALQRVGAVHRDRVQAAGFMVLKSPDIPSLLVETAFISNPTEEQLLRDARYRTKLAGAIRDGIAAYLRGAAQPGQRQARSRQHMVARGDTLSGIAARYEVSAQRILAANKRRDPTVRLGEILRIP